MRHSDGAVPVDGDKSPGQRSGYNRSMDEARVGVVAEGHGGQIEEVDDQDDFGPGKVCAGEEHDEGEVEEVVEDKVRAHGGRGVGLVDLTREKVEHIADLEEEEDDAVDGQSDKTGS